MRRSVRLPITKNKIIISSENIFQSIINSNTMKIKPTTPNAVNKSPTFFKIKPPYKYQYFCKEQLKDCPSA